MTVDGFQISEEFKKQRKEQWDNILKRFDQNFNDDYDIPIDELDCNQAVPKKVSLKKGIRRKLLKEQPSTLWNVSLSNCFKKQEKTGYASYSSDFEEEDDIDDFEANSSDLSVHNSDEFSDFDSNSNISFQTSEEPLVHNFSGRLVENHSESSNCTSNEIIKDNKNISHNAEKESNSKNTKNKSNKSKHEISVPKNYKSLTYDSENETFLNVSYMTEYPKNLDNDLNLLEEINFTENLKKRPVKEAHLSNKKTECITKHDSKIFPNKAKFRKENFILSSHKIDSVSKRTPNLESLNKSQKSLLKAVAKCEKPIKFKKKHRKKHKEKIVRDENKLNNSTNILNIGSNTKNNFKKIDEVLSKLKTNNVHNCAKTNENDNTKETNNKKSDKPNFARKENEVKIPKEDAVFNNNKTNIIEKSVLDNNSNKIGNNFTKEKTDNKEVQKHVLCIEKKVHHNKNQTNVKTDKKVFKELSSNNKNIEKLTSNDENTTGHGKNNFNNYNKNDILVLEENDNENIFTPENPLNDRKPVKPLLKNNLKITKPEIPSTKKPVTRETDILQQNSNNKKSSPEKSSVSFLCEDFKLSKRFLKIYRKNKKHRNVQLQKNIQDDSKVIKRKYDVFDEDDARPLKMNKPFPEELYKFKQNSQFSPSNGDKFSFTVILKDNKICDNILKFNSEKEKLIGLQELTIDDLI